MAPKYYEFTMTRESEMTMEEYAIMICENEKIDYCFVGLTLCTRQGKTWYPVRYENNGHFESDPVYFAIIYC